MRPVETDIRDASSHSLGAGTNTTGTQRPVAYIQIHVAVMPNWLACCRVAAPSVQAHAPCPCECRTGRDRSAARAKLPSAAQWFPACRPRRLGVARGCDPPVENRERAVVPCMVRVTREECTIDVELIRPQTRCVWCDVPCVARCLYVDHVHTDAD